jgi:hypothetical protein
MKKGEERKRGRSGQIQKTEKNNVVACLRSHST